MPTCMIIDGTSHHAREEKGDALTTRASNFYLWDAMDGASVMSALGYEKYWVIGWSDGANAAIDLAVDATKKDFIRNLVVWGRNAYRTM